MNAAARAPWRSRRSNWKRRQSSPMHSSVVTVPVRTFEGSREVAQQAFLSVEEPLQIRVDDRDVSITMRTPGNDFELAAGFLFSEGLLDAPSSVAGIENNQRGNTVTVTLQPGSE